MKNTEKTVLINSAACDAVWTIVRDTRECGENDAISANKKELCDVTFVNALSSLYYDNLCEKLEELGFAGAKNYKFLVAVMINAWEAAFKTAKEVFNGLEIPEKYFSDMTEYIEKMPSVSGPDSYDRFFRYLLKRPDISDYSAKASSATPMRKDVNWEEITDTANVNHDVSTAAYSAYFNPGDYMSQECENWYSDLASDIALISKGYLEEILEACYATGNIDIVGHMPEYIENCMDHDYLTGITLYTIGVLAS